MAVLSLAHEHSSLWSFGGEGGGREGGRREGGSRPCTKILQQFYWPLVDNNLAK